MKKVLVLGSDGQMGQCLKSVKNNYDHELSFLFFNRYNADICTPSISKVIEEVAPHIVLNFAAYTAVDKAETEPDKANLINNTSLKYICEGVRNCGATLIHLSSDYVYHSILHRPIIESDACMPRSVYAQTKLKGEEYIRIHLEKYLIIRTSWVFSEFGNNFVKTMLKLMKERERLNVVNDQIGSPTYGVYLADAICKIIQEIDIAQNNSSRWGLFNYSNHGAVSWYQFACEIKALAKMNAAIEPITTAEYPALAQRPPWSVLSNRKISLEYNLEIPGWYQGLRMVINKVFT